MPQAFALLDAKAVLLVDHHQRQPRRLEGFGERRMGRHNDARLTGCRHRQRTPTSGQPHAAGQQHHRHRLGAFAHRLNHAADILGMLFRQHLRGRHQHRLMTSRHRRKHRDNRHHGLTRTDLALQQALHRPVLSHIVQNVVHHIALAGSKRKRQCINEPPHHSGTVQPTDPTRVGRNGMRGVTRTNQRRLTHQRLLIAQHGNRPMKSLDAVRIVHLPECVATMRIVAMRTHILGNHIRNRRAQPTPLAVQQGQEPHDRLMDMLRRDARTRVVHRARPRNPTQRLVVGIGVTALAHRHNLRMRELQLPVELARHTGHHHTSPGTQPHAQPVHI